MHIPEPVQFPGMAKIRDPADLVHYIHDLVAQAGFLFGCGQLFPGFVIAFTHTDEPFVHQPENQLGFTAPAGWVAVGVGFNMI